MIKPIDIFNMDFPNLSEVLINGEKYIIPDTIRDRYNSDQKFRELYLLVMFTKSMDKKQRQEWLYNLLNTPPEIEAKLYEILHKERIELSKITSDIILHNKNISFDTLVARREAQKQREKENILNK